jgi:hypothetical protein
MHNQFVIKVLCAISAVPALAWAAVPEPAAALASWELTFRYQDPQRVSVVLPGQSKPVVYWYMLYSVENPGEREVDFYPQFELVTDTLRVVRSEIQVSPEAFQAIQRRSGDPLLLTPEKVIGRLLRGKDRAKHGVAIWRDFDPKAKAFKIYASGLSGEFARLENPTFDPKRPENTAKNRRYFVLRKTLVIPYKLPGSESTRTLAVPERQIGLQKWIMR